MEKKKAVIWIAGIVLCVRMNMLGCVGTNPMQQDEQECADQLTNLASCIPFVSGTAQKPTPECCQNTLKLKTNQPKCLCVLIKESTDPSMGLPINTTLALQMPSACNIHADVSDCPSILKLAADSPDAKIFKAASSDSPSSTSASAGSGSGSKATASNTNNGGKRNAFGGALLMGSVASMPFFLI